MSRLLVDVTDLVRLGVTGGIARVVNEISSNLQKLKGEDDSQEVNFMFFDEVVNHFFLIDLDQAKSYTKHSSLKSLAHIARISNIAGTEKTAKKIYTRLLKNDYPLVDFRSSDKVLVIGMAWENLNIKEVLRQHKAQVSFTLIHVVYDLVINLYPHLHHPDNIQPYNVHMRSVIEDSDLLLPISQSSANDIHKFAELNGLNVPNMSVIRLGDSITLKDEVMKKPKGLEHDNFILCVGTIEVRKNHTLLYYTYKLAAERGEDLPPLVIVGKPGWFTGDIQYLIKTDKDIQSKIILLQDINDTELAWLYRNALFTVYPSMYEGWGLPIAESLSYGTPVIASHTSSMPEIGGKLVNYISPYSTDKLLDSINVYLEEGRLKKIRTKIERDYRRTDWNETVQQIIQAIGGLKNAK